MSREAPRGWGIVIRVSALAAVLLAVVVGAVKTNAYAKRASGFCTASCHTPSTKLGDRHAPGHDEIRCQDCHATRGSVRASLLWRSLLGRTSAAPAHGETTEVDCTACHERNAGRWRRVADTSGHHQHLRGKERVGCLSCHRGAGEPAATCALCHEDARLHSKTREGDDCLSCHNFSVTGDLSRPTAQLCDRCHGASAPKQQSAAAGLITADMLHGGVDCKLCHQPHRANNREYLVKQPCNDCHEIQLGGGRTKIPEGHRVCTKCHGPHRPNALAQVQCAKCHEQAKTRTVSSRSTALRHDSCASCHRPHTWVPNRAGCVYCHKKNARLIANDSPGGHSRCTGCHDVHGPPPRGPACVRCHAERRAHLTSAPPKHRNCASCHNPHAAARGPREACARCHKPVLAQVQGVGPTGHAKVGCFGCHQPHNDPRPGTAVCAKCHGEKVKAVSGAGPPKHRQCTSCHRAHTFAIGSASIACSRCHSGIATGAEIHSGACTKCHQVHGSPGVPQSACVRCHSNIHVQPPKGAPQHSRCGSCHKPHRSSKAAPLQCRACHDDKAAVANRWPAGSAHAGPCNGCHQPHAVLAKAACQSCHEQQAAGARGGRHRCTQCHRPHSAPASSWWNRCRSCHARQLAQTKQGKHPSNCGECHKQHRFARPSCVSCHANMRGKGAHAVREHTDCGRCHSTHAATKPGRKQCLSCHIDKRGHQPKAKRCSACHLFR